MSEITHEIGADAINLVLDSVATNRHDPVTQIMTLLVAATIICKVEGIDRDTACQNLYRNWDQVDADDCDLEIVKMH